MTPPPIRYPLPTLVALAVLGLLAWRGAAWLGALEAAFAERWHRAFAGPPVPSSTHPMVVAGPIVRRGLTLHDDLAYASTPVGPAQGTLRFRTFVDLYDVWPLRGEPTHFRIGTRHPLGWVPAEAVLPWDTRLVVRVPKASSQLAATPDRPGTSALAREGTPLPVIAWTERAVRVAAWKPGRPWSEVAGLGWLRSDPNDAEAWSVLLSREELIVLLQQSPSRAEDSTAGAVLRLRAVLGRLLGDTPRWTEAELGTARRALPAAVTKANGSLTPRERTELVARINAEWVPDASWSGIEFRAVPLAALPSGSPSE